MALKPNDDSDNVVNLTHNHSIVYEYEEWELFEHHRNMQRIWSFFYLASIGSPIAIFGGVLTNIFACVVLVRSRLWLKHEGYVYLATNFCVNFGILLFCISSFWLRHETGNYYPPTTSNFVCKMWHFLMRIFFASGWLSVALLFNVYLREHLIHRRRCGCPMFAAKYCTLFASKVILGVIFSLLFVFGIPCLAIYEYHPEGECVASEPLALYVVQLVEAILMWFLPFVFFLPIILLMILCTKREGNVFGFSQIEERSLSDEQVRVLAVTLSSMTLFSQFGLVFLHYSDFDFGVLSELAFALSLGLQPILCFVILKALRDGFRSQLRNIRCCRRLFPPLDRDEEVVRLTSIQEDPPSRTES